MFPDTPPTVIPAVGLIYTPLTESMDVCPTEYGINITHSDGQNTDADADKLLFRSTV